MKMGPEIQYSWSCIDQNEKDVNTFKGEIKHVDMWYFLFWLLSSWLSQKNVLVLAC